MIRTWYINAMYAFDKFVPPWLCALGVALWAALILEQFSHPVVDLFVLIVVALPAGLLIFGASWLRLRAFHLVNTQDEENPGPVWLRRVPKVICFTMVLLCVCQLPLWFRFATSQSSLFRVAQDSLNGRRTSVQRAGLYSIRKVETRDNSVWIETDPMGGFVLASKGRAPTNSFMELRHIRENWWVWQHTD